MRAAIFIDGAYLLRQFQDARITPDYAKLSDYLLAPLRRSTQVDLLRCYFYYCPPWMSEKPTEDELRRMAVHEKFVADIQQNCDRWQVRLGKLEKRRDGEREVFAQKRVDVQLSVDLVHHASAGHIQHAVLCAGDSDFIPAVIAAKSSGATFTLWGGRDRSVHKDLIIHADEVHYFDWRHVPRKPVEKTPPTETDGAGDSGQQQIKGKSAHPTRQSQNPRHPPAVVAEQVQPPPPEREIPGDNIGNLRENPGAVDDKSSTRPKRRRRPRRPQEPR